MTDGQIEGGHRAMHYTEILRWPGVTFTVIYLLQIFATCEVSFSYSRSTVYQISTDGAIPELLVIIIDNTVIRAISMLLYLRVHIYSAPVGERSIAISVYVCPRNCA